MVVTRREQEAVTITTPSGKVIEVVVIQIRGAQVRVAFKCHKTFKIERTDRMSPKDP